MALVAFSIAKRVPNTRIIPQTYRWNGKVAFAPYGVPGSDDLGSKIAEKFAAGYDSVMLESHGVCCGGRTLQDAFQRFETLELCARTEIKASQLGTPQFLTEEQLQLESRSDLRLATFEHGPENMTVAEKNLRNQVCAFIGRGYRQGLFTGATGTISARLDANSFLITPHPLDRFSVLPEELVLVRNGRCEAGKTPSYAALAHRTIYEAHPDVGSVVNANASNCLAFSVCNKAIDTRTLPESYILLREVSLLPFETTFSNMAKMASTLSLRHPAAVLANNGVLVVGSDVVSVFDKLEVLDSTAEAILGSLPIGGYVPIGKDAIDDIVKAFKLPR
jgi:L-fuculose-phosphate aldolase